VAALARGFGALCLEVDAVSCKRRYPRVLGDCLQATCGRVAGALVVARQARLQLAFADPVSNEPGLGAVGCDAQVRARSMVTR
jgi:hypothetical protein